MIELTDSNLQSWVDVPENSDFPIQNIPFGIFTNKDKSPRACSRIGDFVIDLAALAEFGFFDTLAFDTSTLSSAVLNDFIALGKPVTNAVRERVGELLSKDNKELSEHAKAVEVCLIPIAEATMLLPVQIGDYTDFYASKEHATNVGTMFRDPKTPCYPTGYTFLSAITDALPLLSFQARLFVARKVR